jgi:Kef-type K+ transport system membrane component KefB
MKNLDLAIHFFFQIALILLVCRIVGVIARRFGQPQVVAEMIAGVCLGPSLFGYYAPGLQQWIFPWDPTQQTRDTSCYLFPASQLGLALYMFIVGLEFRVDIVRFHFRSSLAVSLAGMVTPFLLGAGLAYFLYQQGGMFPENTSLMEAMLFLGASMCITAFPMLARIIHFKGLTGTLMGTVAIGAGAIDDAAAWCLLAVVLASFDDNAMGAVRSIGGGMGFVLFATLILRPLMKKCESWFLDERDTLSESGFVIGLLLMALGAWFTDMLHLHAVFGAFVVGSIIPRGPIQRDLVQRIQPLAVALLLPLFFTYSGLNTQIGLLNSAWLWGIALAVLLVAILGKGVACGLAARASGLTPRESMGIGALMNARGLMELIIINIGLQRGVITQQLFATLVIMAVVTTLMASPIFDWLVQTRESTSDPKSESTVS